MAQNTSQASILQETDEEIERIRLEQLAEWDEEEMVSATTAPDDPASADYAVALHTTYIGVDYVARFLMENRAIASNPEWFRMAYRTHETLFNLYQTIGSFHLLPNEAQNEADQGPDGDSR